jgi:mannonate dehydratase
MIAASLPVPLDRAGNRRSWPTPSLSAVLFGSRTLIDRVGGHFGGAARALSPGARELVARAFEGVDPARLTDFHVHLFGHGPEADGPFVTQTARSWLHPFRMLQYRVYLSAAGITDEDLVTAQYVERLARLAGEIGHGRFFVYAMDRHYRQDGTPDPEATPFYVPNDHVRAVADRHPGLFVPVASVHPYRADALEELEKWARTGCRYVKWLTTAQGIDPSNPRTSPFYRKMREYGMVLLSHTGEELAVFSGGHQNLGNPLLLRTPLENGVTVVALHCASYGKHPDLESPGKKPVPGFDLFLRLMDDPGYRGLLFGEIAGVTFFNHSAKALKTLLRSEELHPRLVNGSDYPLPAINFLIMTGRLARHGFITVQERTVLNEIYCHNPLLFDFVLKRTLRHPESGHRFPASLFMHPPGLPARSSG